VNQTYVIATSTKVDISGVDIAAIDDGFFARGDKKKASAPAAAVSKLSEHRQSAQVAVDAVLSAAIGKEESLALYLKSKFSLRNGDKPHLLKF
jgi:large subunit ribosomal protein L6e